MMNAQYLAEQAKMIEGCRKGLAQVKKAKTSDDFVNCYFDNIDFCLAKNFPANDYIKQFQNPLAPSGVFVSCKHTVKNPNKLVLLGKCNFEAEFTDYSVSRLYVKHDSFLIIKASGNAFVMVDALDESFVQVTCRDNARVIVNLYSKALCTGATKIVQKNMETYDL